MYLLLKEVARRGGMYCWHALKTIMRLTPLNFITEFSIQYVVTPSVANYSSTTNYMLTILPYVDFYAGNLYPDTVTARTHGVGFVHEILDASLVLVTTQSTSVTPFDVSAFVSICCCAVISFNFYSCWLHYSIIS
jgi:hypothetical protein